MAARGWDEVWEIDPRTGEKEPIGYVLSGPDVDVFRVFDRTNDGRPNRPYRAVTTPLGELYEIGSIDRGTGEARDANGQAVGVVDESGQIRSAKHLGWVENESAINRSGVRVAQVVANPRNWRFVAASFLLLLRPEAARYQDSAQPQPPITVPPNRNSGKPIPPPQRPGRAAVLVVAVVAVLTIASVTLISHLGGGNAPGAGQPQGPGGEPKVGVVLPDDVSAARWELVDRPVLEAAFAAAGIGYEIVNANGSTERFVALANQLVARGVDVLMIVNLDSVSGGTALRMAHDAGVKTIDYDRLTPNGGADYYVSFDNTAVGRLQGEGLIKCLEQKGVANPRIAYLNGSPTDANAALFRNGYDEVLRPKYDQGWRFVGERSVPNWSNDQAATLFQQLFDEANGGIDGVLSANDGLGNAAISVLRSHGLNGKVPVTGQDASIMGLQNILVGNQCMTAYKPIKQEAGSAAAMAVMLANRQTPDGLSTVKDAASGRDVSAKFVAPVAVFKDNVKDVIADGFVTAKDLCTGAFADRCAAAGIVL